NALTLEVDERQARAGIELEVAERLVHRVACVVRNSERRVVDDADETRLSAAMRCVEAALRVDARDEERVGPRNECGAFGVERASLEGGQATEGLGMTTAALAALDVFHAIAERFVDVQLESSRVHVLNDAVDAESPTRREVDDDHAEPAAGMKELF